MDSVTLLKNTEALWTALERTLLDFQDENATELETARHTLAEIDLALRTLKGWVITHQFSCWADEIAFFKTLKPKFIGKFICTSKIITLSLETPLDSHRSRRRKYEQEIGLLHQFFDGHRDFVNYYRRGATYLDTKYFLRFSYDLDTALSTGFHSFDDRFCTSHDLLAAHILAYDEYARYLNTKLRALKNRTATPSPDPDQLSLSWTASKAALTELIFALHHSRALNSGTADLSQTVRWFEQHFNICLGNYHKTMAEINLRKSHRTKFLQHLTENLHTYLDHLNA